MKEWSKDARRDVVLTDIDALVSEDHLLRKIEKVMEDNAPVKVSAALIWRGNKFLICQRPANKARGLLWEFVGGKMAGETGEQALISECREELGVTVELTLYNAKITSGKPRLLYHAARI